MKKRTGDLFGGFVGDADYATVIPTNGEVTKAHYAIMGAGVALRAAQVWPELPRQLGKLLDTCGNHCYVLPVTQQKRAWVVSFPTKHGWKQKADLALIEQSAVELTGLADVYRWDRVFLPRVGCGHGGLDWMTDVRPILKDVLDDRFTVVYDPSHDEAQAAKRKTMKPKTSRMKVG